MDPPRRPRGKARGYSHQANQPNVNEPRQQMAGSRPQVPRPQGPRPLVVPPRPQVPRPKISSHEQNVQQITTATEKMTIDTPVPIGRGAVRGGNRGIETTASYYRAPRPESSLKNLVGKQGTLGQPVQLISNYFPIKSYAKWSLYQYRVNISPEEERINVLRGLISVHREFLGPYLFDGQMLFSSRKYESNTFELISKRLSDDQIMIISITYVAVLETNDYANIQVFNLLLRNCLRHLNLQLIRRNYFDPEAKITIPKHNLQLWPGYETTIGMFDNGLLLRAEITTKVMRIDTVMDFFIKCLNNHRSDYMNVFKSGIIGSIVLTGYNNETYRIDDVDENSNINSTFEKKDGTKMSYKTYYEEKWKLQFKHGNQPMLVSKKKKLLTQKDNGPELVYLVPEFCVLTGFTDDMRNDFNLMKDLAIHTQVGPAQRIVRYNNFINRLTTTQKSMEALAEWNLTLGKNLINITGRVLPREIISSNNSKYDSGPNSDWTINLRSKPMFTSATMGRWVILTPQANINEVQAFVYSLIKVSEGMSFVLPKPEIVPVNSSSLHAYISVLEEVINSKNPVFILCAIVSSRGDFYNLIKRKLCVDRAVPSQVVLMKNIKAKNMSVCTKIAVQINCKIGGAPWHVRIPVTGMMIVGFDVCHDKQNKNISYGALVATINETHTSFFSCAQPHESGQELSNYFAMGITLAVEKYRKVNGKLPSSIVIYRDGVGDGQISHVESVEVQSIKNALHDLYQTDPAMAFIIVKKRISTKFFMKEKTGTVFNPPSGTVIDSVVTDPTMYDFFLVAQNVRFGTVTPTHYNVIEDTLNNWCPDKMQKLTYKLTHMYYNWSGTVRVPALCQLAHKLAFLCGQVLRSPPSPALNELLYFL